MATLTEGNTPADWLMFEMDSRYSREEVVCGSGGIYQSGTVMAQVTATGREVPWDPSASDGSETVTGVLLNSVNATDADAPGIIINNIARVRRLGLTWGAGVSTQAHRDAAIAALLALGIKNI